MARRSTRPRAGPSSGAPGGVAGQRHPQLRPIGRRRPRSRSRAVVAWRRLHDRYADVMAGVLAFVARRFGEAALETCYRAVLEPYIQERYMVFDIAGAAVRRHARAQPVHLPRGDAGHLGGPDRDGRHRPRTSSTTATSCASTRAAPAGARSAATRSRAPARASSRRTSSGSPPEPPPVGLERDGCLLLLRPLQPHALDAAGRALGPPGPDRGSAAVARARTTR